MLLTKYHRSLAGSILISDAELVLYLDFENLHGLTAYNDAGLIWGYVSILRILATLEAKNSKNQQL